MSGKSKTATKSASKTKKQQHTPESGKPGIAKASGWEFAPFTTKAVAFNAAARNLAEYVHLTYGDAISIAAYEKFVIATESFSKEERAQVHLEKDGVLLLVNYQKARDARDAERQAFRSDVKVKDVGAAMATLLSRLESAKPKTSASTPQGDCPAGQDGSDESDAATADMDF